MAAGLLFSLLVGLSFGLWDGADACELRETTAFDCPAGWSWFDRRCFVVVTIQKSWAEAEKHCQNLDSHLASFHNIEEYNFIRQIVLRSTSRQSRVWIGAFDSAQEGTWFWSDGSKFTFSNWGSSQPDNAGENEHCMNINERGRDFVDDSSCDMTLPFICAKSL